MQNKVITHMHALSSGKAPFPGFGFVMDGDYLEATE